ncbi:MAG: hypothetical protein HC834_01315 [Rhodospirillales bacterium]|nr:hypothetical protein [Rhodospirillales bacterium]
MAVVLPYRATTATGACFEISFPLHPETSSTVRVSQMLTALLQALDREVQLDRNTSNGDILQSLAMALAIRASMIEAPKALTDRLSMDLVSVALDAMNEADRHYVQLGHA